MGSPTWFCTHGSPPPPLQPPYHVVAGGLEVTHDNLEQLGEVLAAAENLEVVKEYVNSLASIKPQHKQLPQVLEVSQAAQGVSRL